MTPLAHSAFDSVKGKPALGVDQVLFIKQVMMPPLIGGFDNAVSDVLMYRLLGYAGRLCVLLNSE